MGNNRADNLSVRLAANKHAQLKPNVQRRTAASLLHLIAAKQIPHEQNGPFSDGDPLNLFEFISIWGRELQCWPRFWTPYDPRVSLKTLCFFRTKAITE